MNLEKLTPRISKKEPLMRLQEGRGMPRVRAVLEEAGVGQQILSKFTVLDTGSCGDVGESTPLTTGEKEEYVEDGNVLNTGVGWTPTEWD